MEQVKLQLVTPEIARYYLLKNESNRTLAPSVVNKYARDMEQGNWGVPSTIVFDENGVLKDGQHRLNAVIKSGKAINFIVLEGENKTVGIDRGRIRTTADSLYMDGMSSALSNNTMIGAVKLAIGLLEIVPIYGKYSISDSEVRDYIRAHEDEWMKTSKFIGSGGSKGRALCRKASTAAAAFFALRCGVEYEDLKKFFEITNTGFCDNDEYYAAIVARNYLINETIIGTTKRIAAVSVFEQAIRDFSKRLPRRKSYRTDCFVYLPKVKEMDKK